MSNPTESSRSNQGTSRRRRSRGGKNRSHRNEGQRNETRPQCAEEFRPQSSRHAQPAAPVKLTFFQKILRTFGLYKEPVRAAQPQQHRHSQQQAQTQRPQQAPKSNTRNARTDEPKSSAAAPSRSRRTGDRPRGGDPATVESARVYVGNLSYDVSEQDLQEVFKGTGSVRNVEIVYNRSTHRSKGYGFVEMVRKEDAVEAVRVLHDQFFMGRKMIVSGAQSKGQDDRDDKEPVPAPAEVKLAPLPTETPAPEVSAPVNPPA